LLLLAAEEAQHLTAQVVVQVD
jgi:hypothetical protein